MVLANSTTSTLDIDKTLDVASRRMGCERLFPKQREAIEAFISRRDVFVCLPTGYGKSFCYGCLPIVFDCLWGQTSSIVVVVTPLVAIMKEHGPHTSTVYSWLVTSDYHSRV